RLMLRRPPLHLRKNWTEPLPFGSSNSALLVPHFEFRTPHLSDLPLEFVVGSDSAGQRLDAFLAHALPKYSRVQLRKVIGLAGVKVNGQGTKVAHRLAAGDRISVVLPPMNSAGPNPEEIPLDILYEDE